MRDMFDRRIRAVLLAALAALAVAASARSAELVDDPPPSYRPGRAIEALKARDAAWIKVASLRPSLAPLFVQGVGQTSVGRTSGGGGAFAGGIVAGPAVFDPGTVTFGTALDAANSISFNVTTGGMTWEGATANAFETTLTAFDVAADVALVLPQFAGTLMTAGGGVSLGGQMTLASGQNINVATGSNITIGNSNGTGMGFLFQTTMTPDASFFWTGTTSEAIHVAQVGDVTFDFNNCSAGTSAATNPTFCIHSANQNTTQWIDFKHNGTDAVITTGAGIVDVLSGTGTAGGWLRQKAGEVALNADFTDSDNTFSSTALSVTVISGRTYSFDLALMLSQSTAADGVKIDFNGGAATATNFRVSCVLTNDVGAIVAQTAATSTTLAGVINAGATVTTAQHLYRCSGTFVPSSSNTFIVRAACNADTTGTLTIHRGSWLNMRDANPL